MKRYPREESENISEKDALFFLFLKSVDFHKKPLFCLSDVFHRKTPTPTCLQRSERRKQRLSRADYASSEGIAHPHLKIAAYHYLSYVKFILRHGLSYDKMHRKNRRPDFVRGGGFIMQGFADILPHSDTAEGEHNVPDVLGMWGHASEPHCSAPRERHDESRVFLFSQFFHIPT